MDQAFLGREFLTWLWFRCEADGGTFDLDLAGRGREEVGIVFNDYVSLVSAGEEREENIVKKVSPHRSAEARTALLVGKIVSAARLEIARGDRTWTATLAGDTLDLRSIKYPEAQADDPEERALERLDAMEELGEILTALYGIFLGVRTSPDWDREEAPAISRWIRERAGAAAAASAGYSAIARVE